MKIEIIQNSLIDFVIKFLLTDIQFTQNYNNLFSSIQLVNLQVEVTL